jgi:hypothetical protein
MRDNGASAERACLLHVAGEREQVSEPRAAASGDQTAENTTDSGSSGIERKVGRF